MKLHRTNLFCNKGSHSAILRIAIGLLILGWSCAGCQQASTPTQVPKISVTVELDYRSFQKNLKSTVQINEGQTVLDALLAAGKQEKYIVEYSGSGETAFVAGIDQIANQKAAGDNWTFKVNDKLGEAGAGVTKLKDGDAVVWVFGKYPE